MVKHLRDYKNTQIQIVCNTDEEYQAIIPQLNEIWRNWRESQFRDETREGTLTPMFIFMNTNSCSCESKGHYISIEASKFIKSKEEIINSYSIY